jgi:uncharacterized protein YacL
MKFIRREELKKDIKSWITKEDYWEKLSEKGKDKMLNYATDLFAEGYDEFEEMMEKRGEWFNQGFFIIIGVVIGITGGLVANILHSSLEKYGLFYSIPTIIIFIFLFWVVYFFIKNNDPGENNKIYKALVNRAGGELSKKSKK